MFLIQIVLSDALVRNLFICVFDAFLNETYSLCLSTEVLMEYAEKFDNFLGEFVTYNLMETIISQDNISFHEIYFTFHLVKGYDDDNKFSDLYLSASADVLVTNDSRLLALRNNSYPVINVVTLEEFMRNI